MLKHCIKNVYRNALLDARRDVVKQFEDVAPCWPQSDLPSITELMPAHRHSSDVTFEGEVNSLSRKRNNHDVEAICLRRHIHPLTNIVRRQKWERSVLVNPFAACATISVFIKYHRDNIKAHLSFHTGHCSGQPMNRSVLYPSRQVWYQFADVGGIKGMIGLSGKSEPRTWNWLHATVCASPDCTTTHAGKRTGTTWNITKH